MTKPGLWKEAAGESRRGADGPFPNTSLRRKTGARDHAPPREVHGGEGYTGAVKHSRRVCKGNRAEGCYAEGGRGYYAR